jgi:hypothetical protein
LNRIGNQSQREGMGEMMRIADLIGQLKRVISDIEHFGGSSDRRIVLNAEAQQQELLPLSFVSSGSPAMKRSSLITRNGSVGKRRAAGRIA